MANEGYHEPMAELTDETRDMHRAITSLMEELEAVDWYNQRVDACKDPELKRPELKRILEHNRDEEKEHAAMVLEWIRRRDQTMEKELKDYLFTATNQLLTSQPDSSRPAMGIKAASTRVASSLSG